MPPPPEWTRRGDEKTGTLAVRSEAVGSRALVQAQREGLAVTVSLDFQDLTELIYDLSDLRETMGPKRS